MQVVTTPTFDWLVQHVPACNSRLLIGSPYVNNAIIGLTDMVPKKASRTLVTRTDLRDFAMGSSSLDTLCALARDGVSIRSLSKLHAKLYIFDDSVALVTSANATHSGLRRNHECGLTTKDRGTVRSLARSLLRGFGADMSPRKLKTEELEEMYFQLESIEVSVPKQGKVPTQAALKPKFSIPDRERFVKRFKGWQQLTVQGVLEMPESGFRLDDLLVMCGTRAAKRYPRNQHVAAKLRQQLQILRDKGVVEFVTPGFYRRTMNG